MEHISTNQIVKIGVVVDNIEQAVKHYAELFQIEPPVIRIPKSDVPVQIPEDGAYTWYRGEYRNVRCKTAVIPLEPIYIELIEPFDEPSPWNEFKERHGQGVHYVAFHVEGFQEHIDLLENKGMGLIQKTEKGHERYAYFDTASKLGVTLEFKERGNQ
ncbi:bleomycin resistance protein [Paenibacillus piri]|uniref:Bleomycin resistance protein n=2 Tax=Paenibacillus piri TaxID=2547395 RepID=A0A4R5KVG9_9BACL|nr:bleomycin resistance protein [Paenibacillus piri]